MKRDIFQETPAIAPGAFVVLCNVCLDGDRKITHYCQDTMRVGYVSSLEQTDESTFSVQIFIDTVGVERWSFDASGFSLGNDGYTQILPFCVPGGYNDLTDLYSEAALIILLRELKLHTKQIYSEMVDSLSHKERLSPHLRSHHQAILDTCASILKEVDDACDENVIF